MSLRFSKFTFKEGEKVLCYEPDPNKAEVLYDSKILKCCVRKDSRGKRSAEYLVHFYGWNSSWDRHVAELNILKDNPENRALQRHLAEIAAEPLKGKKLKLNKIPAIIKEVVVGTPANSSTAIHDSNSKDSTSSGKGREDGRGEDSDNNSGNTQSEMTSDSLPENSSNQTDEGPLIQPSFMQLPEELKAILDEDEKYISSGKTYTLPAKASVKTILEKYLDENSNGCSRNSSNVSTRTRKSIASKEARLITKEFVASLEKYFDTVLADYLLYSKEKTHHELIMKTHTKEKFSEVYGFIHLLRMLTILPEFFQATPGITRKQISALFKLFQELIAFLRKHRTNFLDQ